MWDPYLNDFKTNYRWQRKCKFKVSDDYTKWYWQCYDEEENKRIDLAYSRKEEIAWISENKSIDLLELKKDNELRRGEQNLLDEYDTGNRFTDKIPKPLYTISEPPGEVEDLIYYFREKSEAMTMFSHNEGSYKEGLKRLVEFLEKEMKNH